MGREPADLHVTVYLLSATRGPLILLISTVNGLTEKNYTQRLFFLGHIISTHAYVHIYYIYTPRFNRAKFIHDFLRVLASGRDTGVLDTPDGPVRIFNRFARLRDSFEGRTGKRGW